MRTKPPHRGAIDNPGEFAKRFVLARLAGFEKDIEICLAGIPSKTRPGLTHAYFPALGACCGILECLTALHCGRVDGLGWPNVAAWAKEYLPEHEYIEDTVRVLVEAFRHPVAHRGIASGVWVDKKPGPGRQRRITWKVFADSQRPAIEIVPEEAILTSDPPWPCKITHRVRIHLKAMAIDLREGAKRYANDVSERRELQDTFLKAMRKLYPQ